ncbi:MAG: exosortase/archaeosortase family protein [Candidatus Aenigmarchaeota archaeon]|nr:exosortase/archaeosortase family protein [Candidatus Aenigmarchaeota archaeon]
MNPFLKISKYWNSFEKKATKKFTATQARLWEALVFVARFMLLALPFYFVLWINFDAYFLQVLTAKTVAYLLGILNVVVELQGHILYIPQAEWTVEIIKDCVGWKSVMALWGLIFATRNIAFKKRIYGVVLGIPLIFAGNVIRIASSIWLSIVFGLDKFSIIHDMLWQWGLIALVLGIWWFWVKN